MQTIDDNERLMRAFDNCLANISTGRGTRNSSLLPRAACLAVKLRMGENTFVEGVKAVASDMNLLEFRRAYRSAGRIIQGGVCTSFNAPPHRVQMPKNSKRVRELISEGGDILTFEGLQGLSPVAVSSLAPGEQMRYQLDVLFPNRENFAYVYRTGKPTCGILGRSIMKVHDWLKMDDAALLTAGEVIVPNAFTGKLGRTNEGKPSYIAQECLSSFTRMILEFDDLSLAEQCAFWAGLIRTSKMQVLCLVYSGNKSIHGCIRVNAADIATWNKKKAGVIAAFATDDDIRFRVDVQELRPRQGMRLAGVQRKDTGKEQRLLWIKPGAWYAMEQAESKRKA